MNHPRPLLAALLITLVALMPASNARAAVKAGDTVDLTLKLMDGSTVSVATLDDKLTVVKFWATWCPPCVKLVPHLKELDATYAPRGVELISVSLDGDVSAVQRFVGEHQMTSPQAHDASQPHALSEAWGVQGTMHAFIVAPGGELLWQGHAAGMEAELKKALKKYGDKLVPRGGLELKPAIRAMIKTRRDLAKGPEAIPEVAKLLLQVPVEHYDNRVMAKNAVKLHAALKEVDPDGTLLQAALDARVGAEQPTEKQTARIQAFMKAAEAGAAAEATDADGSREAA